MPLAFVVTTTWWTVLRRYGTDAFVLHVVEALLGGVGGGDATKLLDGSFVFCQVSKDTATPVIPENPSPPPLSPRRWALATLASASVKVSPSAAGVAVARPEEDVEGRRDARPAHGGGVEGRARLPVGGRRQLQVGGRRSGVEQWPCRSAATRPLSEPGSFPEEAPGRVRKLVVGKRLARPAPRGDGHVDGARSCRGGWR